MDLQYAKQSFVGDYNDTMGKLRAEDEANRAYMNARKNRYEASGQQEQVPGTQDVATGTGMDWGASPVAPAAPAAVPVNAPTGPDSNAIAVSEASKRLSSQKNPMPRTKDMSVASGNVPTDTARLQALQRAGGATWAAGPGDAPGTPVIQPSAAPAAPAVNKQQVADSEARLKSLQARGPYAPAVAAKPSPYDDLITQAATQAGVDPQVYRNLIESESSFNPNAVSYGGRSAGLGIAQINAVHGMSDQDRLNPQVALPFGAQLLRKYLDMNGGDYQKALLQYKGATSPHGVASMMPYVNKILTNLAPGQNAQAAPAPQAQAAAPAPTPQAAAPQAPAGAPAAQAAAPAQQGPTFYTTSGAAFTVPQQYSDGQIQAMQQQTLMARNAAHMAWLQYQQNPNPQTQQAYQQAVMAGQQVGQALYDAKVYSNTQQAQAGNGQAFSALLNEYSNKMGQPIQVVPAGNGQYALVAKGGQKIAVGDPSTLAGTLGGVLSSAARANQMRLAQIEAEAGATERGKASAQAPIELAKLSNALAISMGEQQAKLLVERIKLGELKVTTNTAGQFLITDSAGRQMQVVDPNQPTKIGTPKVSHLQAP